MTFSQPSDGVTEDHSTPFTDGWSFKAWLLTTLFLMVVTPTVVLVTYWAFYKSPVYVSEVRLLVKSGGQDSSALTSNGVSSMLARVGLNQASSDHGDVYALQSFLLSKAAIKEIGGVEKLTDIYGADDSDAISKIDENIDLEDALIYWRKMVAVYVDSRSNILTLTVRAPSPDNSLQLTNDLVAASERLLNEMTQRGRFSALTNSESELRLAATQMSNARAEMLEFQSRTGIVDPVETVRQISSLIADLRLSQLELQVLLETSERSGVTEQTRRDERQLEVGVLERQVAELQAQLTGSGRTDSVAALLREYEQLKIKEEFASEAYRMTRTAYEKARRDISQQQLYVVQVVPPTKPESAAEPKPLANGITAFGAFLVIWGIAVLLVAAIRDS